MTYTRSTNTIINDTAGGDSVKTALTTRISTALDNLYAVANLIDADVVTAQAAADGKPDLGETSTTAYRGDRGKTAYEHSQAAHAPSNAQKNSDITKEEIEAKLTGEISSHTHAAATLPTASTSAAGVSELATDAEVAALADTGRTITPSGLGSVFAKSIAANGYQKLPGGLIFQWGKTATITGGSTVTVTLPLTFPTGCLGAYATMDTDAQISNGTSSAHASVVSTSQIKVTNDTYGEHPNLAAYWFAIGY